MALDDETRLRIEAVREPLQPAARLAMVARRARLVEKIPPDGWVTKLRAVFGIGDDATWQDILIEVAQTKRMADRATAEFFAESAQRGNPCPSCAAVGFKECNGPHLDEASSPVEAQPAANEHKPSRDGLYGF